MQIEESLINKKQEQIYKLKRSVQNLEDKNARLAADYQKLIHQNNTLEQSLNRFEKQKEFRQTYLYQQNQDNITELLRKKIAEITIVNSQYEKKNISLVEHLKQNELKIHQLEFQNKVLNDQIQMMNIEKIQHEGVVKICSELQMQNKKLQEEKSKLVEQNNILRTDNAKHMKRFVEFTQKCKALQKLQENKFENNFETQINREKDGRIKQLEQDIKQLREVIEQKNKILTRLDKDIYINFVERKEIQTKLRNSIHEGDQAVSIKNTIYFINSEIKKRSELLRKLREKYTTLLLMEENITETKTRLENTIKQKQQYIKELQSHINKLNEDIKKDEGIRQIWKNKYMEQYQIREKLDITLEDILYQNEAMHYILLRDSNNEDTLVQIKKMSKYLRQRHKSQTLQYPEHRFTTVSQLIQKNRELLEMLKRNF